MRTPVLVSLIALALAPAGARAECRASPSEAHSLDVRVSPRAGGVCAHVVDVHEGPLCGGTPLWSTTLSCSQTRRIAVTDRGALVSILARRANEPERAVLLVVGRDRRWARVRLGELLGGVALPGTVTIAFGSEGIVVSAVDRSVHLRFADVEALADARAGRGR